MHARWRWWAARQISCMAIKPIFILLPTTGLHWRFFTSTWCEPWCHSFCYFLSISCLHGDRTRIVVNDIHSGRWFRFAPEHCCRLKGRHIWYFILFSITDPVTVNIQLQLCVFKWCQAAHWIIVFQVEFKHHGVRTARLCAIHSLSPLLYRYCLFTVNIRIQKTKSPRNKKNKIVCVQSCLQGSSLTSSASSERWWQHFQTGWNPNAVFYCSAFIIISSIS